MSRFGDAVDSLAAEDTDWVGLDEVIASARDADITPQEIATLTRKLAHSGETMALGINATDVASTGAPGSLSTMLGPLICRAMGSEVRKITVPGRPAGSLDVFMDLKGYRADLTRAEAERVLEKSGFVQILAGRAWAPLDAQLFVRRQLRQAQAVPSLVIASILAKKLAAGIGRFALDVRSGPQGNFGATGAEAQQNAAQLALVARLVGIGAHHQVSDATNLGQPYIGRGEAIVALDAVANGDGRDAWLTSHVQECISLATLATGRVCQLEPEAVFSVLMAHLDAQGAVPGSWQRRVQAVQTSPTLPITAHRDGTFRLNVELMRTLLTSAQAHAATETRPFPDPCGLHLLCRPGSSVSKDQPLALFRYEKRLPTAAWPEMERAFTVEQGE